MPDKILYFSDSSTLITLNRYYPKKHFDELWTIVSELFKNGKILSHEFVYKEIVPDSGPKDEIGKLISKFTKSFLPITSEQTKLVKEILEKFPTLIDAKAKHDQADPWLIALVLERTNEKTLFTKGTKHIIVSTESEKSGSKIPAVCIAYKIQHMNLFQFFEDNNIEFSTKISKK